MSTAPISGNFGSSVEGEKVLQLVRAQRKITRRGVEALLAIGQTVPGRLVKQMVDKGLLIQEGKGKNTRYFLPK